MKRKVLCIAPPKVHLLDLNGPAHIFYEAKEYGADIELHFISTDNRSQVTSSAGLKFYELKSFSEFELTDQDFIIAPGMAFSLLQNPEFLKECIPFFKWLRSQNELGVTICSICTGTFLLAASGILAERSCTTHWKRIKAFKNAYPNIDIKENRLFVADRNILSSAGISSGIDLSLYILEKKFSTKLALDVAKEAVIYFRRGESDPQLSIFLKYRNHLDERIHQAQEFILKNMGQQFNQIDIADHVNMSVRNLTRLFKQTTGITIHSYTAKLRIEHATNLISKNNKLEMVAMECGFKSVSHLSKVLNGHDKK
ncbi:DJ-1/PfpI family protein [uncultured Croceitalea sp.]|uniref:GlxA family transcriptional regulator n=1 Tax=uncultured Croceitalea sp. TaxID=1798908 RepID=UPI003305F98A